MKHPTYFSYPARWVASVVLCACLQMARADEAALLKLAPKNAMIIVSVEDTTKVVARWEEGPFGKLFQDEEVKRYLAPMQKEGKDAPWDEAAIEATSHTFRENIEIFKGALCVSIPGPSGDQDLEEFFGEDEPSMLIMGEIGPDPAPFRAFLAKMYAGDKEKKGEGYSETTDEYLGVTLTLHWMTDENGQKTFTEGWAVVGEVAISTNSEELLREKISQLKNPPEDAAIPADLLAHRERVGASDLTVYLNSATLMPSLKTWVETDLGEKLKDNPYGISASSLWKALALENLTGLAVSVKLDPEQTEVATSVPFTAKNGVLSLLTYTNGALPTPDLVPANVVRVSTCRYDFPKMWDNLFVLLGEAGPGLPNLLRTQLEKVEESVGIDIRKDILGGLGEDFVFFEEHRKSESEIPEDDTLFAISLTNRQGVESALTTLRNFLGQGLAAFEERDVLGVKVYSFALPAKPAADNDDNAAAPLPVEINHAVTDRWLLIGIGSSRPIERAIAGLNTPGESVWSLPAVKSNIEAAGDNLFSFEYYNYGGLFGTLLTALNTGQSALPEEQRFVDPEATPDASVMAKYMGITTTTFGEVSGAFFSRTVLRGSANE